MEQASEQPFIFAAAGIGEADQVLALYQSVTGGAFCTWNEYYPGMQQIREDVESNNLFVLRSEEGIVGASSIVPENELDDLELWKIKEGKIAEIARVAVAPEHQGKGLALTMVNEIEKVLKSRGYRAVHLLAAKVNLPACHTYRKAGYKLRGECDMFGHHYCAHEKELD
jgi:ribosomal protein S18 acetylase RimI-like enzyme